MKQSFLIYYDYKKKLDKLSDKEYRKLIDAMFDYEIESNEPDFSSDSELLQMIWMFIQDNLDRDKKGYDRRCETSKGNGEKGGRPSKEQQKNADITNEVVHNDNLKEPNNQVGYEKVMHSENLSEPNKPNFKIDYDGGQVEEKKVVHQELSTNNLTKPKITYKPDTVTATVTVDDIYTKQTYKGAERNRSEWCTLLEQNCNLDSIREISKTCFNSSEVVDEILDCLLDCLETKEPVEISGFSYPYKYICELSENLTSSTFSVISQNFYERDDSKQTQKWKRKVISNPLSYILTAMIKEFEK